LSRLQGLLTTSTRTLFNALVAERGVSVERGVSYGAMDRHKLDIYHAASKHESGPIAVFIYGGNWQSGSRTIYRFVGAALAAHGVTTVIPDYRLFPAALFPDFVEDAALAYAWAARELALTADRPRPLIVIGHSAGAHIGALLSLDRRYLGAVPQPHGFVGLAGPYAFDLTTWPPTQDIFVRATPADTARPVSFARRDAPPTLVMHGLKDETVELWNMRAFVKALAAAGATVEAVELPGLGHAGLILAISKPLRWRAPVLKTILEFVTRHAQDHRGLNGS